MSKRVSFSKDVLESDTFFALSLMAQLTYIYVCMTCDKNGMTIRARSIARANLGTDEYVDELEQAGFRQESCFADLPGYLVLDWDKHTGRKEKI